MEGDLGETKTQQALSLTLSVGKSSLEEKLALTSPKISHDLIDPKTMIASSRPRSRCDRLRSRRKSFESLEPAIPLMPRLTAYHSSNNTMSNNINSNSNNDNIIMKNTSNATWDEKGSGMTPSNSNQSLNNKSDAKTPATFKIHHVRQRSMTQNRRKSFDTALLSPSSMTQAMNEINNTNGKSELEHKLAMTSPNNNKNALFDTQRLLTFSRPRSRSGRPRNHRRSMSQLAIPLSLISPGSNVDDENQTENDDTEKDERVPTSDFSGHEKRQKASQSLPSSSGHSGFSYFTEMTIHTDRHLLSNEEESGDSRDDSSSCYYSDGGIAAIEQKMHMSFQFNDDDDEYDEEDDSSNSKFNYEGRDNGSHITLDSAFSLSELGSNDSVSSLSDDDGENSDEKRIQFTFSPSNLVRQHQRFQRQASHRSIGRRRRRPSYDSILKSGDEFDEVTVGEEDLTHDGSINGPNPNKVSNNCHSDKNGHSTNAHFAEEEQVVDEEMTLIEVETDDENDDYIEEEVSLNDSEKRYEILISEESFEEELLTDDVDEEEITVEDYDVEQDDSEHPPTVDKVSPRGAGYQNGVDDNHAPSNDDERSTRNAASPHNDNSMIKNKDAPQNSDEKVERNSEYRNNGDNKNSSLDEKNMHKSVGNIPPPPPPPPDIVENFEGRNDLQRKSKIENTPRMTNGRKKYVAEAQNRSNEKDAPLSVNPVRSWSAIVQNIGITKDLPTNIDEKTKSRLNSQVNGNKKDSSLPYEEKSKVRVDNQNSGSKEDTASKIYEKTEQFVSSQSGDDKKENPTKSRSNKNSVDSLNCNEKTELSSDYGCSGDKVDKTRNGEKMQRKTDSGSDGENIDEKLKGSSGYRNSDTNCGTPRSYRDALLGS